METQNDLIMELANSILRMNKRISNLEKEFERRRKND